MNEGDKYGVDLWSWLKIKYKNAAKLDLLRQYYGQKIRLLKLKSGGLLVYYIKRFQSLTIIWEEIDTNVQPEYRLVTHMVEQIEDPLFSGPYKSINNWDQYKCTFCDAADTLCGHEISKMTAQTKKAIKNEVNSVFLGSGSNKRRATGEQKALHALRLGDHEDKKIQEERITLKVWKMMTPEARTAMRSDEEVKIGLAKNSGEKDVKYRGGKMYQHNKKACGKLPRLNHSEKKKNDASYMKSLEEFITKCGGPP